ncbi:MAG: DUF4258 domain-containing protein [Alphaproteobacteria bacterium]|nr:DUF4258 domain-containing protein [Alphaproteobacteria bacterium]
MPLGFQRISAPGLERRIRTLAGDTANIDWSLHALDRMEERGILDVDALRVLRQGSISSMPTKTGTGEWKCKMTKMLRGQREVGVVTIVLRTDRLFIVTVEWEDLR